MRTRALTNLYTPLHLCVLCLSAAQQVAPAGYNMSTVSVDGTVIVSPKRSWLFPPSLLLPDIPIRATIKLGVRGPLETGQVSGGHGCVTTLRA